MSEISFGERNDFRQKKFFILLRIKRYISEYCANTSLHGFKYIGEPKRTLLERLCWAISVVLSIIFVFYLTSKTYIKWKSSPIIVSFSNEPTYINSIPFAAVTICPETKFKKSVYNATKNMPKVLYGANPTDENLFLFKKFGLLCDLVGTAFGDEFYNDSSEILDEYNLEEYFQTGAPDLYCDSLLWSGKKLECSEELVPVLTEEGKCYSFNFLNRDLVYRDEVVYFKNYGKGKNTTNWSLGSKFKREYSYPRKLSVTGEEFGFKLILGTKTEDLDYICRGPIHGFKIILHLPNEAPVTNLRYFRVSPNEDISIAVKPEMMTTSNNLISYSPRIRNCFFEDERTLRYFKTYTQQNCEMECTTNITITICGCAAFYMPRNASLPICGIKKNNCYKKTNAASIFGGGYKAMSPEKSRIAKKIVDECNCLPTCLSLTYFAEISQYPFEWKDYYKVLNGKNGTDIEKNGLFLSKINIFYSDQDFLEVQKNELFGTVDFLANCGGIFGLCIGFSILSILELIYYFSLRLFCNNWLYGNYLYTTTQ